MDKKYKKLIEILNENNLTRISFEENGKKYEIERSNTKVNNAPIYSNTIDTTPSVSGKEVKSPILGTFYKSSSPDKKPFIKVGDKVKKGQVIFIIEAMKVLNEINSPIDGVVKEIKFNDGELVQFDETVVIIG